MDLRCQEDKAHELLPNKEANILIDNYYIMASLGVMSKKHPAFMAEEAIGVIIASDKDINAERFNGMN